MAKRPTGYSLLQHLRVQSQQNLPLAPTIQGMDTLLLRLACLPRPSGVLRATCLGASVFASVFLPQASFANPPGARLNHEERQRLRQELRQQAPNLQLPNQNVQPRPAGAMQPQAGQGQLSPDDRRALRQQLREQRGRDSFTPGAGEGPVAIPANSSSAQSFKP